MRNLEDPQLIDLQNRVRGLIGASRNRKVYVVDKASLARIKLRRILADAKATLGPENNQHFLEWAASQVAAQIPFLEKVPYRYEEFGSIPKRRPLALEYEIDCTCSFLALAADEITTFLHLVRDFESTFWADQPEILEALLGLIEHECGQTLWLIEASLATTQLAHGLEAQKRLSNQIGNSAHRRLAEYFSYYVSVRNEPSVTPSRFSQDFEQRLTRTKYPNHVRIYMRYRLAGQWPATAGGFASILQVEQGNSPIDLYETLIAIAQRIVASDEWASFRPYLLKSLRKIASIEDFRLQRLFLALGEQPSLPAISAVPATDYVLKGNLSQALKLARSAVSSSVHNPLSAAVAMACGKNFAKTPVMKGAGRIIQNLANVIRKTGDFDRSYIELQKLCRNWSFLPSIRALQSVCELEGAPRTHLREQELSLKFLNVRSIEGPESLGFFEACSTAQIREHVNRASAGEQIASRNFAKSLTGDFPINALDVDPLIKLVLSAIQSIDAGDITSARNLLEENGSLPIAIHVHLALRILQKAFTHGDTQCAADLISRLFVIKKVAQRVLPLQQLGGADAWRFMKSFSQDIAVPIVLDLMWKETNDERVGTFRRFAAQQFLSKNGLQRPSDIGSKASEFQHDLLVYFLKEVCVPTVLDMMTACPTSQSVDEERVKICALLSELDPDNSVSYQDEILFFEHRQVVQSGLRIVDSSRIHVDSEGITKWAKKELEEGFLRYSQLVQAGIGLADSLETVYRNLVKESTSKEYFEVPANEADEILVRMLAALKERFFSDTNCGLDSFLSKRIRHESLTSYIRSPAEQERLITQQNSQTKIYDENTYWLNKLNNLTADQIDELKIALVAFSEEFDGILLELKTTYFHMRSKDKPDGLFDVQLTPQMLHLLRAMVQEDLDDLDAFLQNCYIVFWAALESSLAQVRDHLQHDTKPRIARAFERLRATVGPANHSTPRLSELSAIIGDVSGRVQAEVDMITGWFIRQNTTSNGLRYTLEQATEIATQSALKGFRSFHPKLDISVPSGVSVIATNIISLADIMRVVLGNVHKHSKIIKSEPSVQITGELKEGGEVLGLKFISDVAPGVQTVETESTLEHIRSDIAAGTYTHRVREEGESGLRKIASTVLRSDKGRIVFGFKEENKFVLELDFPLITDATAS